MDWSPSQRSVRRVYKLIVNRNLPEAEFVKLFDSLGKQ
jgi:hypothetical protein